MWTYTLTAVGAVYAVTGASLTRPLRVFMRSIHPLLGTLFSCPPCVGFWLGFGFYRTHQQLWWHPAEAALATCGVGVLLMLAQSFAGLYDSPEPEQDDDPKETTHG